MSYCILKWRTINSIAVYALCRLSMYHLWTLFSYQNIFWNCFLVFEILSFVHLIPSVVNSLELMTVYWLENVENVFNILSFRTKILRSFDGLMWKPLYKKNFNGSPLNYVKFKNKNNNCKFLVVLYFAISAFVNNNVYYKSNFSNNNRNIIRESSSSSYSFSFCNTQTLNWNF